MDQPITVAAAAASSATAVLWLSGVPPDLVWLAALSGGLLSLWGRAPASSAWLWVISGLGQLGLSVALGVGGAAGLPPVLAGYSITQPLAAMPSPVIALLCSLFAPGIYAAARRWLDSQFPATAPASASATASADTAAKESTHG